MSKSYKRRTEDYDGYEYDSYGTNERERSLSPPPPPKISKADVKKSKTNIPPPKKLQIKLNNVKSTVAPKPKLMVASVFNQESDSEPEEMPPEAKMRMRNIGRDTPTSAGPNSFGKTKHGFCDAKKVFEKSLKEAMNSTDCD